MDDTNETSVVSQKEPECVICSRTKERIAIRKHPVANGFLCCSCKTAYYRQFEALYKNMLLMNEGKTKFDGRLLETIWNFLNDRVQCSNSQDLSNYGLICLVDLKKQFHVDCKH